MGSNKYEWRESTPEEIALRRAEREKEEEIYKRVLAEPESKLCQLYHDNNIPGCPICHECERCC